MSRRPTSDSSNPPSPPIPLDSLLTVPQAAERLQVSVRTIRAWIFTRRIEYVKLGSAVRIRESVLQEMLERGRMPAIES